MLRQPAFTNITISIAPCEVEPVRCTLIKVENYDTRILHEIIEQYEKQPHVNLKDIAKLFYSLKEEAETSGRPVVVSMQMGDVSTGPTPPPDYY
jgi:hypothetical protein